MARLKTVKTKKSPTQFINSIRDPIKKADAKKSLTILKKISKKKPVMWGSSIIGFGSYHYKYVSGREGDWMLTGFSPRKDSLTFYIMPGYRFPKMRALLKKLGPHKTGVSCLYIKKLDDVHIPTLEAIIGKSLVFMKKNYKFK